MISGRLCRILDHVEQYSTTIQLITLLSDGVDQSLTLFKGFAVIWLIIFKPQCGDKIQEATCQHMRYCGRSSSPPNYPLELFQRHCKIGVLLVQKS